MLWRATLLLMYNADWKPRRTLIFASWGAEEYGLIGSTEWVEEHAKILSQRTVAYLNIDVAVNGKGFFRKALFFSLDVIC